MTHQNLTSQKGFSLVELMLVCALTSMLAILVGFVFEKGHQLFDLGSAEIEAKKNSRRILLNVANHLRQAQINTITIPAAPNNDQISFDLPLFQENAGSCSAFDPVSSGTPPVSCATTGVSDCNTACGNIGSNMCVNSVCRRTYTYAVSSTNGLPQLIVSAANEPNRIIGNNIETIVFEDDSMDVNLNANEIRMTLTTTGNVISEKRTHRLNAGTIVQVRN